MIDVNDREAVTGMNEWKGKTEVHGKENLPRRHSDLHTSHTGLDPV
jgi:hypothetical protein